MSKVLHRNVQPRDRGDTIVEVMFAIALLGAVLGSAYVVVGRNVKTNQASQERTAAVKVAESQLERLKIKAASDASIFTQTDFCLTTNNEIRAQGDTACKMDGASNPTTNDPAYNVTIKKQNDVTVGTDTQAGVKFKITVRWISLINASNDQLDYYYEAYK